MVAWVSMCFLGQDDLRVWVNGLCSSSNVRRKVSLLFFFFFFFNESFIQLFNLDLFGAAGFSSNYIFFFKLIFLSIFRSNGFIRFSENVEWNSHDNHF
jgi:hypothetical protein